MSKIALTPNASGTGVFTISSPATNTNRTLTLPDEAGTVLTSASSLASANLTGTVTVSGSNVGIGTTTSLSKLTALGTSSTVVNGASTRNPVASFRGGNDNNRFEVYVDNSGATAIMGLGAYNSAGANTDMTFYTGPAVAERLRITSSGNVLVGCAGLPSGGGGGAGFETGQSGGRTILQLGTTVATSEAVVRFYNPNGNVGSINLSGSATSYNTSSDYRLKTDAQPMTGASARVQALNPVNFEWIADGTRVDGFLAHEAQEIVPECVTGTKDAMRDEQYEVTAAVLDADGMVVTEAVMGTRSVPDMQGIDQSKLVPLLTAALQEALTEISALKVRVAALEAV
jgi:hypothetical protein